MQAEGFHFEIEDRFSDKHKDNHRKKKKDTYSQLDEWDDIDSQEVW